jgi:hypothetical protein
MDIICYMIGIPNNVLVVGEFLVIRHQLVGVVGLGVVVGRMVQLLFEEATILSITITRACFLHGPCCYVLLLLDTFVVCLGWR